MKVTVIIPSRNERFLPQTVADVLGQARGDLEVIVCLDGYWPDPPLPADPRLHILHRGDALGMRDNINAAAALATGDFLMKLDGHCQVAEGYDVALVGDYVEDNWILTPRRYALDAEHWCWDESNPGKYPVDYEHLSWPWAHPDDPLTGFHGQPWSKRREQRKDIPLDLDVSSQGSCWFMSKAHWQKRIVRMDTGVFGSFFGESQEIGLQTQLLGGAMMRTKRTWYAHLRKSTKYGRGYSLGPTGHKRGAEAMLRRCVLNEWPGQVRSFESVIQQFDRLPGWPADWEQQIETARREYRAAA